MSHSYGRRQGLGRPVGGERRAVRRRRNRVGVHLPYRRLGFHEKLLRHRLARKRRVSRRGHHDHDSRAYADARSHIQRRCRSARSRGAVRVARLYRACNRGKLRRRLHGYDKKRVIF